MAYIYKNQRLVPLQISIHSYNRWPPLMGFLANVPSHCTHFYCMATVTMDRRQGDKLEKIFRAHLHPYGGMEYPGHLVGG